jgi:hypothetical protein
MNPSKIEIKKIYPSNSHGNFKIIKEMGSNKHRKKLFEVEFLKTGTKKIISSQEIKRGEVKDPFLPRIAGVGYLGNVNSPVNQYLYSRWRNILHRCCNEDFPSYKFYGAKGISVDKRWYSYEFFEKDIKEIEGWDESRLFDNTFQLDKDKKGQNCYSKNNCIWITQKENNDIRVNQNNSWFIATDKEGQEFLSNNQEKFAKEHNLTAPNICNCLNGKYSQHKGWKFELIEKGDKNGRL